MKQVVRKIIKKEIVSLEDTDAINHIGCYYGTESKNQTRYMVIRDYSGHYTVLNGDIACHSGLTNDLIQYLDNAIGAGDIVVQFESFRELCNWVSHQK